MWDLLIGNVTKQIHLKYQSTKLEGFRLATQPHTTKSDHISFVLAVTLGFQNHNVVYIFIIWATSERHRCSSEISLELVGVLEGITNSQVIDLDNQLFLSRLCCILNRICVVPRSLKLWLRIAQKYRHRKPTIDAKSSLHKCCIGWFMMV
jgi:hypothetical protein